MDENIKFFLGLDVHKDSSGTCQHSSVARSAGQGAAEVVAQAAVRAGAGSGSGIVAVSDLLDRLAVLPQYL